MRSNYSGCFVIYAPLRLALLALVRPGKLRHTEWDEFDLDSTEYLPERKRMNNVLGNLRYITLVNFIMGTYYLLI